MKNKRRQKAVLIILVLSFIISCFLVYNIVDVLKHREGRPDEVVYRNSVHSDIVYDVYLKQNDFFNTPYIGDDFSYITDLVEYIKTSFTYNYEGDNDVTLDYTYYIKGEMISNYMSDAGNLKKPLWVKEFTLLENQRGQAKDSNIEVAEVLDIGLNFYNDLLEEFRDNTNLVLESRLDITFVMMITSDLPGEKKLNQDHYMTMSVPLGVKAFDINMSKSFPEHEVIYSKEQPKIETSYMIAILLVVIQVIVLWISIYFVKLMINADKNKYEAEINKLLKDYDDRIVTVSSFVRYEKLDVVNVPDFNELLTLSDESMEPIIYWEKRDNNMREAWFSIIKDRILYRHVISYKGRQNIIDPTIFIKK